MTSPGRYLASTSSILVDQCSESSHHDYPVATVSRPFASLSGLVGISIVFYLLLVVVVLTSILRLTHGTFVYPLDDPYIHLAMAEQLVHGHYGINALENSSPSSSILWPLLLTPLAGTPWQVYLPLVWNIVFGVISAGLIGAIVASWPTSPLTPSTHAVKLPRWQQALTAMLLILLANLVSLTFIGMEHVLQIMLSICCAIGVIRAMEGRNIPPWCLAAAIAAPMVRYENLALTVAVAIALVGLRQRWKAALVVGFSLLPLVAFSLFLKAEGLPLLPTSVLVKGGAYKSSASPGMSFLLGIRDNLVLDIMHTERSSMLLLLIVLLVLFYRERFRTRRFVIGAAAWVASIQLLIGRFGWFHRYEVYAFIFIALILVRIATEQSRMKLAFLTLILLFCARPYIQGTLITPEGSLEVYQQQYQMHRFMVDFYRQDIALNDLGLVSYQRPPGVYVLDLYGLASPEASRQSNKTADWMQEIVQRHRVSLAMLYTPWFQIPPSWVPLARMCLDKPNQRVSERCVDFYSTSATTEEMTRTAVSRFASTVPQTVLFTLYPSRNP